jgi:putative ABC transport system permease protein
VCAAIDRLFENGPQRTTTTTEAAFQAGFASMFGNLPLFLGTIGGAVVFAVAFTVINVMLMGARQRGHECGILKALGFSGGAIVRLVLVEALLLSLIGGGLGILLSWLMSGVTKARLGSVIPTYHVEPRTMLFGALVAVGIGLLAGIGPAIGLARLGPTEALRSEG